MSHLFQRRELADLCKQGVPYPFSGSDYDKSSRPATIKIGRIARLFLYWIADIFSFTPHLRRTSGVIYPHMFIVNATKHHPVPSRTGTQTTNCSCISHIHKHRYTTIDIIFQYPIIFLLEMFGTYHVFIIACQRINFKRIVSSLPYRSATTERSTLFQKVIPLIFNQFLFCILSCALRISRHPFKIIKDH